jgi:hypothetical protein
MTPEDEEFARIEAEIKRRQNDDDDTQEYAHQRQWVGLSEDEINKLRHLVDWTAEWSYGRFAYELERLLREKNGGAA